MRKLVSLLVVAALTAALALTATVAFGATKKVGVKGLAFSPKSITVKKGTTVKWSWKGSVPHNVTVTKGPKKFHSKSGPKVTFSKKLTTKGTYTLVCTFHKAAGMTMKIKVK